MSNKIDNNFGAGSANYDSPEKKPREQVSGGKNFGDLLQVDERDEYRSQAGGSEENESTAGSGMNPFDSIVRNLGPSRENDNERDDSDSGTSSRTENRPRTERQNENKPEQKPHQKHKRVAAKGEADEIEQEKDEKEMKEISQPAPLAAFQVPMQVDFIRAPAPVEKTAPMLPAKMLDQIVQEVRLGINAMGEAEFQFDLKSDVLEGLKLKISTKDGHVSAFFIAENVHVKDTIDQSAQELIKALQARGLEVANFQVSVGADTSGSRQDQQQQSEQQGPYVAGRERSTAAEEPQKPGATRSSTDYTI